MALGIGIANGIPFLEERQPIIKQISSLQRLMNFVYKKQVELMQECYLKTNK